MKRVCRAKTEYYLGRALVKAGLADPARRLLCSASHTDALPDEMQARRILTELHPKPQPDFHAENRFSPSMDLTVVVPAYNVEMYIEECIESVLRQKTDYNFEVIVVENGSTDSTAQKLQQYKDRPNVTLIFCENCGVSTARNRAIARARGAYLTFLDSDDWLEPDAIQTLMREAYATDADIVQGSIREYFSDKKYRVLAFRDNPSANPRRDLQGFPSAKAIRSELFASLAFPANYLFEDSILAWLLYPLSLHAATLSSIVYNYRKNRNSISNSSYLNPRVADAYWIYEAVLEDRAKRKIPLTGEDYSLFLRNILLAYSRMRFTDEQVRKSVFVLFTQLRRRYFPGMHTDQDAYQALEAAMDAKNWWQYKLCCLLVKR